MSLRFLILGKLDQFKNLAFAAFLAFGEQDSCLLLCGNGRLLDKMRMNGFLLDRCPVTLDGFCSLLRISFLEIFIKFWLIFFIILWWILIWRFKFCFQASILLTSDLVFGFLYFASFCYVFVLGTISNM